MKKDEITKIVCPHCGCEYLPSEIFIPDTLLGKPKQIVKNVNGEIQYYDGIMPDNNESYVCDNCGKKFNVVAHVSYTTSTDPEFQRTYVTKLFEPKLTLDEGK